MFMIFIVLVSVTLGLYQNHIHSRQGLIMVIQIVGKQSNPSGKMMIEFGQNLNCDRIVMMLSS